MSRCMIINEANTVLSRFSTGDYEGDSELYLALTESSSYHIAVVKCSCSVVNEIQAVQSGNQSWQILGCKFAILPLRTCQFQFGL